MARTDLKIKSTDPTGKNISTSVSYVNKTANSATLKTLAQKITALTQNQYQEADRVNTINVDSEQVPVDESTKPLPTVTVYEQDGLTPINESKKLYWNDTYNEVQIPFVISGGGDISFSLSKYKQDNGQTFVSYEAPTEEQVRNKRTLVITTKSGEPFTGTGTQLALVRMQISSTETTRAYNQIIARISRTE